MTTRSQSFILFKFYPRSTLVIKVSLEASMRLIPYATSEIRSMNELPGFFPPATEKKNGKKKAN